jgi:hypothetical protein
VIEARGDSRDPCPSRAGREAGRRLENRSRLHVLRWGVLSLPVAWATLAVSGCGSSASGPGGGLFEVGPADAQGAGHDVEAAGEAETEVDVEASTPEVAAIALSSCVPTVYTGAFSIGGAQQFQLSVDTGSTTLGVASVLCSGCGVSPLYAPGPAAVDEHSIADSQYGSGSWSGEIYQDTVGAGTEAATPVDLVAIDTQVQFFEPIQCDSASGGMQGIIGLGPSSSALPGTNGYFDALVAKRKVLDIFATELCDSEGTLWLGGYDPSVITAPVQFTPLTRDVFAQYYYSVNLVSVAVSGTTVPIATSQYPDTVVDTGTSIFLMGMDAYSALTGAIASDPQFQSIFGGVAFFSGQGCATVSMTKAALDASLPALTLTFGSSPAITVTAPPTESYLFPYGQDQWCPALDGLAQSDQFPLASILGAPMLRSNVTIFDRANQRIGFAPHTACP